MTGLHRYPRALVFAGVAILALAVFTMAGCSPTTDEASATDAGPGPAVVVPDSLSCCSCSAVSSQSFADPRLPCQFDYPASWESMVGGDGALISAITGPSSCDTICPNGEPGLSVSYGMKYDSNADAMLSVWPTLMSTVGSARCGEGTVQFFSPPGDDPTGFMGGVKFYVQVDGKKYSGGAMFTCGEPGGWLPLRDMFVNSFRDNPASTFPGE